METNIPLAEQMRPQQIDEIIGQQHLFYPGSMLSKMIENDNLKSIILWGPPGCGKTTIAKIIENNTKREFIQFSAVLSGIKEVKQVMQEAEQKYNLTREQTILFIDEIHRFSKSQQDAFLPYVESGTIILLGATTENPSFEVIPALLSRCTVFVLNPLDSSDIRELIIKAKELYLPELKDEVLDYLVQIAGGDGRKALNNLDMLRGYGNLETLGVDQVETILQQKSMTYDKGGEEHYNVISAFQKSIRGSDPQAGLYWLARMLEAGEDPMYIVRRLVRIASEDVGLADPNAIIQAIACKDAVHFLGMPEANTSLSQLVVYLATAPKSNAVYKAYNSAREMAVKTSHLAVPMHIRNAPTKLMKDLSYNEGYKYSHDYNYGYHYQKYFPDKLEESTFYTPSPFGFEKDIQKRLEWWEKLKKKQLDKSDK